MGFHGVTLITRTLINIRVENLMDELTSRAFTAYFRRHGELADQPANTSGEVVHDGLKYVVLHNANGVLAVYRVTNRGQLKHLTRWPDALNDV